MTGKKNDFKKSVEFDLYKSEFGNTLLKEYHIKSLLSKGDLSNLYLLERNCDGHQFVLKAIPSNIYMAHPIALKKYPGLTEITAVYDTAAYRYLLKTYVAGQPVNAKIEREGVLTKAETHHILIQVYETAYRLLKEMPSLYLPNLSVEHLIIDNSQNVTLLGIESIRCASRDVEDYLFRCFNRLYVMMSGLERPSEINNFNQWGYFLIASKGIHL